MTLLDEPPAAVQPPPPVDPIARSTTATWRFAARLARREVRRRPGRTLLAALLVAVPVAAMTAGSIVARTNAPDWAADFRRDYGGADIVLGLDWIAYADDPSITEIPAGGTVIGSYATVMTSFTPAAGAAGEASWGQFTDIDFTNPAEAAGVEILDGRAPRAGEVLLDPDLADQFGVSVGDELQLSRPSGTWLVAGLGRMRGDYWRDIVAMPGFDLDRIVPEQRTETTLIDMPADTPPSEIVRLANERGGITRFADPFVDGSQLSAGIAWGYVAGVLALVAVGIIVAAAFATSARRQLVTIGQLTSNGAPERLVRRTLSLQGSWTGAVGAVLGVAGGFAVLPVAIPLVEQHIVSHELRALRISVGDLLVVALTAIVAATVAAAVPARSASRVPVMAALAGRRPAGQPPQWLVPTGLVLAGGGLGLVAIAALGAQGSNGGNNLWAAIVVLGATALVFGVCCASPLVVERVGRLGRRAPLSTRMALRSLARSRTRSAAVVAAIAVAVGGAVALAAIADQSFRSNARCCPAPIPADTVLFHGYPPGLTQTDSADPSPIVDPGPMQPFAPPVALAEYLDRVDADVEPLYGTTFDPESFDPRTDYVEAYGPWVATPGLLDVMSMPAPNRDLLAEAGAISTYFETADAVAYDAPTDVRQVWEYRAEGGMIRIDTASPAEPIPYALDGNLLITEDAAREAGFDLVEIGAIVRFDHPLTRTDLRQLADLQQSLYGGWQDAFVEPGDPDRSEYVDAGVAMQFDDPSWRVADDTDLWIARSVIVAGALVLSLLVVAIGLALSAVEGRDERDTFHVVGAKPSSMRRLTATRGAVISMLGIVLGVPLGFVPVWVVDRITNVPYETYQVDVTFPWLVVAVLLVVIPLVAASGAWAGSGIARRFRPPTPTHCDV